MMAATVATAYPRVAAVNNPRRHFLVLLSRLIVNMTTMQRSPTMLILIRLEVW